MAEFTLTEICAATKGEPLIPVEHIKFNGIATDTRRIRPGDLFIALQGERFDGHDFIPAALQNGAAGVIVSRRVELADNIPIIKVEDTLKALQALANFHRQRYNIPVIAVTGSNGKTTTKDMIAAVLASQFNVLKTEANFNNEIGLPLTLLNLNATHDVGIVEMGMRGLGQIKELAEIALPNIGVVTNVGETHIELLGSIENISKAKSELVECLPKNGLAILNGDNNHVRSMGRKTSARILFYGFEDDCDVQGVDINTNPDGIGMEVSIKYLGHINKVLIPTVGRHNVYNALAAVAVGLGLGMGIDEIGEGLKNFVASGMRLAIEPKGKYTVINDAYNASPLSMAAAIDTLIEITNGRKIVVLGDMLELGQLAVEAHQKIGRKVGQSGIDVVVTVGELAAYIAEEAGRNGAKVSLACKNHEEAANALKQYLMPGDTILIKGSRGMKMEQILDVLS